jgi:hypothetical protein
VSSDALLRIWFSFIVSLVCMAKDKRKLGGLTECGIVFDLFPRGGDEFVFGPLLALLCPTPDSIRRYSTTHAHSARYADDSRPPKEPEQIFSLARDAHVVLFQPTRLDVEILFFCDLLWRPIGQILEILLARNLSPCSVRIV